MYGNGSKNDGQDRTDRNESQSCGKIPMVQKYPFQIWAAARSQMALTCAQSLYAPAEDDIKNSPLEMHSGFSVFRLAIADRERGSVTANIPADDVPYILEEYHFQRDILKRQLFSRPKGLAYTESIPDRNCQNKTPAEVLCMANGLQTLNNARDFLQKNLSRFPKNQVKIQAIDEAVALYQAGKLSGSAWSAPLYHKDFKWKAKKDNNGFHQVYFINISGTVGTEISWNFTITNCKARMKGNLPDMETSCEKKELSFKVTQEEMDHFIYRLGSTLERFEAMMYRTQFMIAQKYRWTADDGK